MLIQYNFIVDFKFIHFLSVEQHEWVTTHLSVQSRKMLPTAFHPGIEIVLLFGMYFMMDGK